MEYDEPPAFPQALRGFPQGEPSASSLDLPADWRSKFDPQTGRVFYYRLTADHQAVVTESVTWSRPTPPPPCLLRREWFTCWFCSKAEDLLVIPRTIHALFQFCSDCLCDISWLPTMFLFVDFVVAYGDVVRELTCMLHGHSYMVLADYFEESDLEAADPPTKWPVDCSCSL